MKNKNNNVSIYIQLNDYNDCLEKLMDVFDCSEQDIKRYIKEGYIVTELNDVDFTDKKNIKYQITL